MPNHAQLHDRIFRTMFCGLDINGDRVVSTDEWELYLVHGDWSQTCQSHLWSYGYNQRQCGLQWRFLSI